MRADGMNAADADQQGMRFHSPATRRCSARHVFAAAAAACCHRMVLMGFVLLSCVVASALVTTAHAEETPRELQEVGIEEHLGAKLSLDTTFTNEAGEAVPLQRYFDGQRPVVLVLQYYECPMLCGMVMNGALTAFRDLEKFSVGKEFQFVGVSIDPTETATMAAEKKVNYLKAYERVGAEAGWHFLVGNAANIATLAREIGFRYHYDAEADEFAHPAMAVVLTPEGRISRYLYGIDFRARDVRLSLVEASAGKIGNVVDRFLLYCYHYDPKTRKYALLATRVMRAGASVTVVGIGVLLWGLQRMRRRGTQAC